MNPLKQGLEVELVVLVTRCDGEGQRQLRVGAARSVDPVSEDEAVSASSYPGVRVASPGSVVHGSPAVGLQVGAVHRDDLTDDCP